MAGALGGARPVPRQRGSGGSPGALLPGGHVPVPVGRPAPGPRRGGNGLPPIGWDAFGLPAENAAIRNNTHPADWTYANIETQAASFRRYATSFDWSRRLQTCDPTFYRWNQWLFLRFYERGLAYRRDGYVNWCPVDQTQ